MADTFLHGVETIQVASSTGTVSTIKTAVIGLIGTSPTGTLNSLKLCLSSTDDDQFGTEVGVTGTIRQALFDIRKQLPGAVVFVVNVKATDTVTAAEIIGTNTDGVRTGALLFETCKSLYGFNPKIFICPKHTETTGVVAAIRALALKYRGVAYIDADSDVTYATALTSRGESGDWNFSDYRAKLLFPHITGVDAVSRGYSAMAAGLRAYIDINSGFWFSSSNNNIEGIQELTIPVSWELNDPDCEANELNAIGITTLINVYGSGFREWGNRTSSYPVNEDTRTFESMQRLDDITSESIEIACLPYIDRPMTKAQIDLVTDTVNTYFNTLIGRGALIQGSKCTFDSTRNSTTEMAKGHYVWTKTFMGAVPGERFTFYSVIDTSLLTNLIS